MKATHWYIRSNIFDTYLGLLLQVFDVRKSGPRTSIAVIDGDLCRIVMNAER